MELNNFIKHFAKQFEDTDLETFEANTYFQELEEWDSLTTMSVIAFIKTQYGITVSGKEIRSCETIEELFNLVTSK